MKKKIKIKIKKKSIVVIIIILLIIIIEIVNPIKLYNKYQLKNLGYSDTTIDVILENNLKKDILTLGFNNNINNILSSRNFKIDNYSIYKEIDEYDLDNYVSSVNSLIEKGYTSEEINLILKNADNESLESFLKKDYIKDISKFLKYDFSVLANIDRYIAYQSKNNSDNEIVVLYVNIGLDKDFYEDTNITNKFSYDMLVNKYNGVSKDFIPDNLVDVPSNYGNKEKLNDEALKSFIKMSDDCKSSTNYKLIIRSGYRDYQEQEKTYNSYLKTYGKKYTEDYVTHPGYSEHHTGLAVDIKAESSDVFASSKESKWVLDNAYKYGYILRYKKSDEDITGIKYESWHYRYVGNEIATYIHDHEMTFEEYYVRFLNK